MIEVFVTFASSSSVSMASHGHQASDFGHGSLPTDLGMGQNLGEHPNRHTCFLLEDYNRQ